MASKVKLPISLVHKGTRFQLVRMLPKHVPEVEALVQQCVQIGSGLGIDEGVTAKAVNVQDKPGHLSLCMVEEVSGSIAALASIFPCPLARSTRPVTASGYIVFRPDCQDQGLLATLFPACARIMPRLGYIGLCARAQWPAVSQRLRPESHTFTGLIPNSQLLKGQRRVDDCVVYTPLMTRDDSKDILSKHLKATIPEPPSTSFPEHLLNVTKFEPVTVSSSIAPPVTLRSATLKDMPHVEDLIRQAALQGEGFALDEFQDGFFNRKFLRRSHTLVATQSIMTSSPCDSETPHERVIGAALFGPTMLCRSESTTTMGCYLIVHPEFRRQGIGKSLLRAVEEYSRSNGFNALLSDVFVDNTAGILMANRSDFMCVGSLHKCAVTKNSGLVDSLMYHKYLDPIQTLPKLGVSRL